MKALRKLSQGAGKVSIEDVPKPKIGEDEVLMKVWATGICGSDLLIERDKHFYKAPVTLGHEYSGIAAEVGSAVKKVEEGDKIVGDIETDCGWLGVTRDGGFASYMVIPEQAVYVLPEEVPLDCGAFAEPVVATIHALGERSEVRSGDFVVVVGPGPMGLLGVQFAKLRGARAVALVGLKGVDEGRLQVGKETGADHLLYSEEEPGEKVMELTDGRGADVVLEASASGQGMRHAIDCARRAPEGRGGKGIITTISLWGEPIELDLDPLSLNQLEIRGAWSWRGAETWERALDIIVRGKMEFDPLITGRYDIGDWKKAFSRLRDKKEIKAFIQPNETDREEFLRVD